MPKGTAGRPVPAGPAGAAALQAAVRQARERAAAAAVPVGGGDPDPPAFCVRIAEAAPAGAGAEVRRSRDARSHVLGRARKERKAPQGGEASPDPRGRGGTLDVRL